MEQPVISAPALPPPIAEGRSPDRLYDVLFPGVFAATLLTSAFLMFVVQPLLGKLLLPELGGAPAVWNACVVFFQAVLFLGYLYAHWLSGHLPQGLQVLVHGALLALAAAFLPPALPQGPGLPFSSSDWPVAWVLVTLSSAVGPLFFAVSATAPLLQHWFARSAHPAAENPYPLYAASNLGSLLALLGYPFLIEPHFPLRDQGRLWGAGYLLLAVRITACGVWALRGSRSPKTGSGNPMVPVPPSGAEPRLTLPAGIAIFALAFVPSSLLLGVTTLLTTDIAAIPMLWILPLAIYLLTFVLAFSQLPAPVHLRLRRLFPAALLVSAFVVLARFEERVWLSILALLAGFFVTAWVCHGEMANRRPPTRDLTRFYIWVSLGGIAGGLFNTFAAPVLFDSVVEFSVVLVAGCLLLGCLDGLPRNRRGLAGLGWEAALVACAAYGLSAFVDAGHIDLEPLSRASGFSEGNLKTALAVGLPLILLLNRYRDRVGLAVLLAVVLAVIPFARGGHHIVFQHRDFFGVLKVTARIDPLRHLLIHGNILHGDQGFEPEEERLLPTTYYHREGPVGQIIEAIGKDQPDFRMAAVGLGAGTLAAYGTRENFIDFYELSPAVAAMASDPALFTYLSDCRERGCNLGMIIGDARLRLSETDRTYDLIVVDAFSSDSIPVHLATREAVALYLSRLSPRGVIAFHVSNRYVDISPVLGGIGYALRLSGGEQFDLGEEAARRSLSRWVALARETADFRGLEKDSRWGPLEADPGIAPWTDDYSNLASVFQWGY